VGALITLASTASPDDAIVCEKGDYGVTILSPTHTQPRQSNERELHLERTLSATVQNAAQHFSSRWNPPIRSNSKGGTVSISANTDLGAAKTAHYGIGAIGRGGEYEIGILPTNPGHEHKFVCQKIDIAVIEGRPVIELCRR
jgi:hypothetical protein